MNDYDKAGRYLVKRDPSGFFKWLFANPDVDFHAWVDARRVALPKQTDLTNDLVAVVRADKAIEGVCLELEAEARADALTRMLAYLTRLWTEPGSRDSMTVSCVTGAILDLTGRSSARTLSLGSAIAHGCRLELTVLRRHLTDENAANSLATVAAGLASPWTLGWIPLMQGGNDSAIISQWIKVAENRLSDERACAELGALTLVFATLAGCRPAWENVLRKWNMKTVPFLDEIRAEGREEGRTEGVRTTVLRLGRQKFGKAPTKKQQKQMEAITDLPQLETLAERLLHVDSWGDLLADL